MRAFFTFAEPPSGGKANEIRSGGSLKSTSPPAASKKGHRRNLSEGDGESARARARRRASASTLLLGNPSNALSFESASLDDMLKPRSRSFGYEEAAVEPELASILADKLETGQITEEEYDHMLKIAAAGSKATIMIDAGAGLLGGANREDERRDEFVEVRLSPSPPRRELNNVVDDPPLPSAANISIAEQALAASECVRPLSQRWAVSASAAFASK